MHRIIHEESGPSKQDLIEYASCLRRVGLIEESLRILDRCGEDPAALLQKAFCFVHIWEYPNAAGILLRLISQNPGEREARVARVNLVASLIFLGELDAAEQWLGPLEAECEHTSPLLHVNCREFRAQIAFLRGDLKAADHLLEEMEKRTANQVGSSRFSIEKWRHVVNLSKDCSDTNLKALNEYRNRARAEGHWESLRSLDWELAKATGDKEMAIQVYFGTPFAGLRRQILSSEFGSIIPDHFVRVDSRWKGEKHRIVNVMTGENMPFKFGSLQYRAMMLLLSDHYQPWTVYRSFDGLFGDEAFNPFSSPKRVYQLLERIRIEVKKQRIPLELRTSGRGFRLRPIHDGVAIVLDEMRFGSVEDIILKVINRRFPDREFTLGDVTAVVPLSVHQSSRALRKLVGKSAIERLDGTGKAHKYKLKAS
ncbi:MAG: tetratricopeptide repeat protein [Bdellovibrionales bacterium]